MTGEELSPAGQSKPGKLKAALEETYVRTVAGGVLTAAVTAPLVVSNLLTWQLVGLGVVAVACLLILSPVIVGVLRDFFRLVPGWLKHNWVFLLVFVFGVLLAVGVGMPVNTLLSPPAVPREVLEARAGVAEIERAISDEGVKRWSAKEEPEGSHERLYMRGYELIFAESLNPQGQVLRTYLKNGKRIAEDVQSPSSNAYSRKYYRDGCNFATDVFDTSGNYVHLIYDEGCRGRSQIIDIQTPRFSVPVPIIVYR